MFPRKKESVADDEDDITTVFKPGLEKADIVVDDYTDPVLALSGYKPDMYDLLLFDIKMPKMNGFELYEKIKDIEVEKKKDRNKKLLYALSQHMKTIVVNLRTHFKH
jgi:CheY-like chemotaxis protein